MRETFARNIILRLGKANHPNHLFHMTGSYDSSTNRKTL